VLIQVAKGVGTGPTELAAFDQALVRAGVANFNLIYLSSVLPPGSKVAEVTGETVAPKGSWGDRLYLVMAQQRTTRRYQSVWAGIGWIQDAETGTGLLVEHEGHSEAEIRANIEHSLNALADNRGKKFGSINMVVTGTKCTGAPVCALAVAVFESSPWRGSSRASGFSLPAFGLHRK
jgi:arginine decarboxylase